MMRILLANPNMTVAMTDDMTAIARRIAGPGVEIVPLTAARGFPYIASRAEALIAGGIALEMIAEHAEGADAAIIAAFGDPGLIAAREMFDMPVIGMAEAAVMTAAMLGQRFSVVTFSPVMTRWYLDCVKGTGLGARCVSVRTPPPGPVDVASVRSVLRAEIIALACKAVEDDGADVVILGGAPLAGLAQQIAGQVPALVIDPISAAVAQAIALATTAPVHGYGGRASKPGGKASVGLGPALAALMGAGVVTGAGVAAKAGAGIGAGVGAGTGA
ncbi:MAG: allantoin racemase [Paracoccaceae bacterium]|jgi:allantoin racemase